MTVYGAAVRRRAPLYALYVADVISLAGNAVAQLAIPWFVLTTTGSASLTGLAVFFNFLPVVLAAFFGGVVVDRLGFRTASVVADLASAGAVAAIPLLDATVGIELWQLFGAGLPRRAPGRAGRDGARSTSPRPRRARRRTDRARERDPFERSSRARSSSERRSVACWSQRSVRRRRCGSTPRASSSRPRSSVCFVPRPAASPELEERGRLLRRARRRHAVHLEAASPASRRRSWCSSPTSSKRRSRS